MGAAIWSSSLQEMRRFPLPLFLRFFEHHGLLDIAIGPSGTWCPAVRGNTSARCWNGWAIV
jgi:predicted NAD/FAD-binding protein